MRDYHRAVIQARAYPGRELTRREREVLTRCAEREVERVLAKWRAEDRVRGDADA